MSKASHSDELVTRINHADINCEILLSTGISGMRISFKSVDSYVEKGLCTLIKGLGDYLTRVVGSVPIDLKITLRVYDDIHRCPVTVGPLHYEGQGQAMSESEEAG